MRRRLILIGVIAVVGAGATGVWAATRAADTVTTVTGCVTSNGQLRDVAVAGNGTSTCKAGEQAVTLSSGDITGIDTPAGGGLTGGASSGTVALGILPSFQLPQGCASGNVIRYSAALQYWTCGSTFEPKAYEVFRQTVPFHVTAIGPFPGNKVLTLQVPPGKYTVAEYLTFTKSSGSGIMRCNTFPAPADAAGNILLDTTLTADSTVSGTEVESLPTGGAISAWCRQLAGATGATPVMTLGTIVASSVQDWTLSEDTSSDQYGG